MIPYYFALLLADDDLGLVFEGEVVVVPAAQFIHYSVPQRRMEYSVPQRRMEYSPVER